MKFKIKRFAFALTLLSLAGAGFCDQTDKTISRIGSWGNGNFFFETSGTGVTDYYFSITTDAGRSLMNIILTAYSLGKNVDFSANETTHVVTQVWTH